MTIFYLLDLGDDKLIESYEGVDDTPPPKAIADAKRWMAKTRHGCVLARSTVHFSTEDLKPNALV